MSTKLQQSQKSRPQKPERSIHDQHVDLIERTLESLKAEAAAGTPVDPAQIADLEQRLIGLRLLKEFE